MKPIYAFSTAAAALSIAIAAAVSAASSSQSAPAGQNLQQSSLVERDYYLDAPRTPGTWLYEAENSETFALYGVDMENPVAIVRCDLASKQIGIGRFGASTTGPDSMLMRLTAETGSQVLDATPRKSSGPLVAAELDPNDPMLDAIAITKGRFVLEVEGTPTLYLPAWAEISRVIEDCR